MGLGGCGEPSASGSETPDRIIPARMDMEKEPKITVEREDAEITLTLTLPPEALREAEERVLRRISREVVIPGFRPGKAPRNLVLAHYGEEAFRNEVREELIREWLNRALDREKLEPVSTPRVEVVEFKPGEVLSFKARFSVLPEIEIPEDIVLELPELPPAEVSEEEVREVLEGLRRDAAILEPKETPAEEGDLVQFRHRGRLYEAEIKKEGTIGERLKGRRAGETVVLKDDEGNEIPVEITGVYRVELPDEAEVAAHYGEESWERLEERVRERIRGEKEQERLFRLRLMALDALADAIGLEPPKSLLEEVVEEELASYRRKKEVRPEVEEMVRRRLRREILARRIVEAKGLIPDIQEVKRIAEETGWDPRTVRARLILERAADWILEHLVRKPKEG